MKAVLIMSEVGYLVSLSLGFNRLGTYDDSELA